MTVVVCGSITLGGGEFINTTVLERTICYASSGIPIGTPVSCVLSFHTSHSANTDLLYLDAWNVEPIPNVGAIDLMKQTVVVSIIWNYKLLYPGWAGSWGVDRINPKFDYMIMAMT